MMGKVTVTLKILHRLALDLHRAMEIKRIDNSTLEESLKQYILSINTVGADNLQEGLDKSRHKYSQELGLNHDLLRLRQQSLLLTDLVN